MRPTDICDSKLLIVDDTPDNIGVLFEFLGEHGFEILIAEDAEDAIQTAQMECKEIDLILLDVMLPGMDGFEACRRLKSIPETQEIPVIFMTALTDVTNKIKGFEVGAVDYITKPFQQEEVLARIDTHLNLRHLQKTLEHQNSRLLKLNQEKNEFLGIAVHDLKNPLSAILGLSEFLKNDFDYLDKEQIIEYADMISQSGHLMFTLITNLLDVNAIESGMKTNLQLKPVDIQPILQTILANYLEPAKTKNIHLHYQELEHHFLIMGDANALHQILDNLISNAVKYSPHGKNIYIRLSAESETVCCEIIDEGPGLNEEDKTKLFGKFTRLSSKPTGNEHSTGLGLFIAKKLTEAIKGKVWCESEVGKGAKFTVELQKMTSRKCNL